MDETVGSGCGAVRDDRSVDSGVSSLRGNGAALAAGSGDERSGSRSSAFSSSTECDHPPRPVTPNNNPAPKQNSQPPAPEVWRDPSAVSEVRHVESSQHSRLLMSSPAAGYGGGAGGQGPPPPLLHPPMYGAAAAVAAAAAADLWAKANRYPVPPGLPPGPLAPIPPQHLLDQDRIRREQAKDREKKLNRERDEQNWKLLSSLQRDRVRYDRDKLEKQRAAEQAVHKHFEESLRLAQQKQQQQAQQQQQQQQQRQQQQQQQQNSAANQIGWINSLMPSHGRLDDKSDGRLTNDRLRQEAAAMAAVSAATNYYQMPRKEYPPPAHHRAMAPEPMPKQHLPKAEPNFSMYGPAYSSLYSGHLAILEQSKKADMGKPSLVVSKALEVVPTVPLSVDSKSSVIVKNDKSPGLHRSAPSPKVRDYQAPPLAKSPYEYRSPSASPHLHEAQNLASISKVHVHRQHLSPHSRVSPLPPQHHRQSPQRQSPHPPYKASPTPPQATITSYPYPTTPSHYQPRPRVPSPHKPRPAHSKAPLTPSPYQQLSQHNLPPPQPHPPPSGLPPPPAAHAHGKPYKPMSPPACQPLDLNISSASVKEEPMSPKRKAADSPLDVDIKRVKVEIKEEERPPSVGTAPVASTPPAVDRVCTPAPSPVASSPAADRPNTPQDDKSGSPGPPRPSYPVHKLKKAWLQRHSGEDTAPTSTPLPTPASTPPPSAPPKKSDNSGVINSLQSIGSMAVNSIKKPKAIRKSKELNGHVATKNPEADDSSSSDPERKTSPQKRVPPKVKRKKGGRKPNDDAKRKKTSASSTDSDKESVSDKDSDSGTSNSTTVSKKKEEKTTAKKRGRKPKTATQPKNGNEEESRCKKLKEEEGEESPVRDSLAKPTIGQLKKSGESFLQDGPCFEVAPKLAKCRECRMTPNQRSKNMPNIFCRFYAFRRLRYNKNGQLAIAGFSDPHRDALQDDLKLWLPLPETPPRGLDVDMAKFLLTEVGDQFCDLLQQEKEATSIHMSEDKTIAWKRVVQGVREMCDVCETTLFNFHWACGKCGFVVCIDCYKSRKNGTTKVWGESGGKERDEVAWLTCTNRQAHEQEKLMLTQIIAGDSLATLGRMVHETRRQWAIPMYCVCAQPQNGISNELLIKCLKRKAEAMNGVSDKVKEGGDKTDNSNSPLTWLANVALSEKSRESGSDDERADGDGLSTLRQLLIRPARANGSRSASPVWGKRGIGNLEEVISSVIEHSVSAQAQTPKLPELKHFVRRYNRLQKSRDPLPIRIMTLTESKVIYSDVPHSWLCDGKLLRLLDSKHPNNYRIFQDQWKRGQPIVISDVTRDLDPDLWSPESFVQDFGDTRNDLVDCVTGAVVNQPIKRFWEGFQNASKRIKDDNGQPMLLKLKDWPPGDDFADALPSRFQDLMKVLPMGEYTQRNGRLNLASRLPDCFVRPDLGPKMYTAYGMVGAPPTSASTNLHLDISDAVNVMVHVGIPSDLDYDNCIKDVLKAVDEAGCDMLTRRRVREKGQLPGALWHIYMARDADKIRDLLNKVAEERGVVLEAHHDPIHDQSWYLDASLRDRLYKEYGVEGYTIVQCLGDAVFIPAGAPHQVRNLHNCVKVAEDFVSPENVSHCFNLTQEFRDLTDTHTNHEDKLQIKNIMYHAVKDSLAVLSSVSVVNEGSTDSPADRSTPVPASSPPPRQNTPTPQTS